MFCSEKKGPISGSTWMYQVAMFKIAHLCMRMYVQAGLFFRTSEDSCRVKTAAVGRYCLLGLYVFTRKQPAVQAIHASSKLSGPSSNNNGYDRLTAVYGQRSFSVFICNRSAHSGVFAHFF